jgi:hypothetical protein
MTSIIEIKPQTYAITSGGHTLRQHYFTLQTAQVAAQQLKRLQ